MAGPRWDERYSTDDYLFGTEPAAFVARYAGELAARSNVLAVADGEGRNSVFLAEHGMHVTAMDASTVGVDKARRLATDRGVDVDFRVSDIDDWAWEPERYDAVVAVFIQFLDPDRRAEVFGGFVRTLRPGGRLLLHGYRPEQVDYATGGPPDRSFMYTEELLRDAFAELRIDVLRSYDTEIVEGSGHVGMSALIDLVATKPID
ncbi:MAG: class I SAM-dependent methyltransferase [Actinomycetota bacterium]